MRGRVYKVKNFRTTQYTTTREIIKHLMQERSATLRDFEMKGIPGEFVKFCLK